MHHLCFMFAVNQTPGFEVQLFQHSCELAVAWLKRICSIGLDFEWNGYTPGSLAAHLWYYIRQSCLNGNVKRPEAAYKCIDWEAYKYHGSASYMFENVYICLPNLIETVNLNDCNYLHKMLFWSEARKYFHGECFEWNRNILSWVNIVTWHSLFQLLLCCGNGVITNIGLNILFRFIYSINNLYSWFVIWNCFAGSV